MNKFVLALFLSGVVMMGVSLSTSAETRFGITGGMALSGITAFPGSNNLAAFNLGFNAIHPLSDNTGVEVGIKYVQKGAQPPKIEGASLGNLTLDYLEIPVLFRYTPKDNLYLIAGPYIGFILDAKQYKENSTEHLSIKEQISDTDWGLQVGTAYRFTPNWEGTIKFSAGFSNIAKNPLPDQSTLNRSLEISATYLF